MCPATPTLQEHIRQAEANAQLAQLLVETAPAWSVTIAFYAALHWVAAYAALRGVRHQGHHDRDNWVGQQPELAAIDTTYGLLSKYSRISRYDCPPASHRLRRPEWVRQNVFGWMHQVHRHIDLQLQQTGRGG